MWYGLRISTRADPDFVAAATELTQSTFRVLIYATGGICLVWYALANSTDWWITVPQVSLALIVIGVTSALALRLLPRRPVFAQSTWLIGLSAAVTFAIYLLRRPEIAVFYMLLPLLGAVTMTWPAGLLAEGVVAALVWWLSRCRFMPTLPGTYSLMVVLGGAVTAALGWAVTNAMLTVTEWSLRSFERARQQMDEAREQRVELRQIQEDLVLANRELARLSGRLKAMHRIAEEARRAKEEFVANVSHELRTPLNMIIGFSEMITELPQVYGGKLPQALFADIAAIQRNSEHLAKLVDDVLDLSQIDAGHMSLVREWVSIQEIVEEASEAVGALFESKGLCLKTQLPPDQLLVFCDRTRIRQVVINLLSNAGRFTERGGVLIEVKGDENGIVVLSVADTGPGISPGDQHRLFEPFQQLDSSITRRHGGSGLGLSISKRFVEMHGGKMWLESPSTSCALSTLEALTTGEVGPGTTVYFSMPREMPLPAAVESEGDARRWFSPYDEYPYKVRSRRSKAPVPTTVPRFVFLEEGKTLRRLFGRYLGGFEAVSVRDAEEAFHELSRSPAQALVVNAPLLKGVAAPMAGLSDLPYGTPTVTCWVPGEDEAARRLGVVSYLVKPVSRELLLSTLESVGKDLRMVLLVDDEEEVLQLFARMVSSSEHSYRILQTVSGQRALSLMRERRPDVVLLDLLMPGLDGFQVLQEKAQDPAIREIPVVVVSARDPEGDLAASRTLTVTSSEELSVRKLVACIQAVGEILSPSGDPS